MSGLETSTAAVHRRILEELRNAGGRIPFSRFMELALYTPEIGYYERESSRVGKTGDFITSVSVGPLFGELLARHFGVWMDGFSAPRHPTLCLIESGAHDGRLARDLLGIWKRDRPDLYERTQYWSIENSPTRRHWQREILREHEAQVRWVDDLDGLPDAFEGVFYANELFDAFPVTRVVWSSGRGQWVELGVELREDSFQWISMDPVPLDRIEAWMGLPFSSELLQVLPDGFTLDVIPAAARWWGELGRRLGRGYLVTLDYGLEADEFLAPHRKQGTLRAYHRQRVSGGVLSTPGELDLTAHVNWTSLKAAGESVGLKTVFTGTQRQFLVEILSQSMRRGQPVGLDWTPKEVRQFQALTHPEHLGRAFRVLVQGRSIAERA